MIRHLPAARVGIVILGKEVQEQLIGRHAQRQHKANVPVVGQHMVYAGAERQGHTHLGGFLTLARDHKGDLALAIQHPLALIDGARQKHQAVRLQ